MAQRPGWSWQHLPETGMQFTDELVHTSRKRVDQLGAALRREVQALGIAAGNTAGKDTAKKGPATNTRPRAGTKKPSGSS